MKYNGFTNVGSMYQAKCKANELPIKFVKVKVGNGLLEETEDPAKFIDVKSLKKEVVISEKTQIEDAVRLTIQMDNDGVTEGYFPREFGIYVEDEGVEVLYWYVNDGNEASYLPSQSTAPVKLKNHFNIIATTLESLVVNWSGKEFWVDKEYLEKKMEVNGNLTTDKINGLAGGYNGTFPLISAIKDNIYLLPATNKFYVCIENYSGSSLTVPNANFEELSVFQNRNKLENLFTSIKIRATENEVKNHISIKIPYPEGYTSFNSKLIIQVLGENSENYCSIKISSDYTSFKAFGTIWFDFLIIFIKILY